MKDAATTDIPVLMAEIGQKARIAAQELATAPAGRKDAALTGAADALWRRRGEIAEANAADMAAARQTGLHAAMLDRLKLDEARIGAMAEALRAIAGQADPVGEVMAEWTRPSGLTIRRVRTPIGVIGVIYESRPNVTADAGALCLKSGNAAILRGGSESARSAAAIHACLVEGLAGAALPEAAIQLVPTTDRAAVGEMLIMQETIDAIVPRGGKSLVSRVQAEARVPVFAHLEGVCHVYVDRAADADKALAIVLNAKTRRPGICGAAECLLVHRDVAATLGQRIVDALIAAGVEVRAEGMAGSRPATAEDFGREFLEMTIAARVVDDIDAAIAHVRRHGSGHTEAIITEDDAAAQSFLDRLDSAILMHNASTQFADGGEFGMGAEIGIATGKLHARGPVGATQLTSHKYLVTGDGTIRD